jgi:hypothetical protein
MKALYCAIALLASAPAIAQTNVSVTIGQPGFYGRIDIGDFGPPPVIFAEPIIVQRPAVVVPQRPIYLRVPPGHAQKWSKHCHRYNACGQPVMFVQDSWYQNEYAPRVMGKGHGKDKGGKHEGKGHGKGHGNGKHKD